MNLCAQGNTLFLDIAMVVCSQAEMALRSDGFVDIDIHTLESVLSRETLNCKETHLWDAALRWASAECARREVEATPVNQRRLLGESLPFIYLFIIYLLIHLYLFLSLFRLFINHFFFYLELK